MKKNKAAYSNLLEQIEKFLLTKGKGKKLRFETEFTLFNDAWDVCGRADLVAFDEYNNMYIFDFKTKETGKEWLFNYKKRF